METGEISSKKAKVPFLLVHQEPQNPSQEEAPRLILNEENVTSLLANVGDRPISLFCVAGPQKTGKSLLFGYMVKYLAAAERDNADWIDWSNPEKPLADEFHWSSEMLEKSPDNSGIWSFNRPFIILAGEEENQEEIAVILLYAQSSKKYQWTTTEMDSYINGLAIAASSCTLFNIQRTIDEKCLSAVANYVRQAVHGSSTGNPQDHLGQAVFVIRDWSYPTQYPYGMPGGEKFIQDKIHKTPPFSSESRLSRELIKASFQKVSGCLLPFPGLQALDQDFQGSISEMEEQFREELEHFIADAINLDELICKRDDKGEVVDSGTKWKSLLKKYISTVNQTIPSKKTLTSKSAASVTLVGEQKRLIPVGLKTYVEIWKNAGKDWRNMKEKEMKNLHKRAKKRALEAWRNEVGGSDDEEMHGDKGSIDKDLEEHLKSKLEERFQKIMKEKENKDVQILEQRKAEMVHQYEKFMEDAFPLEGGKIPSEKGLKRESEEIIGNLLMDFDEIAKERPGTLQGREYILQQLKNAEGKMFKKLIGKRKRPEADSPNGHSAYLDKETSSSLLASPTSLSNEQVTDSLDFQFTKNETISKVPAAVHENITGVGVVSQEEETDTTEMIKRATQLVENLKESFISNLNNVHDTGDQEQVEHVRRKALEEYEQRSPHPVKSENFKKYMSILEKAMSIAVLSLKAERSKHAKVMEENLNKVVLDGLQRFERNLKKFVDSNSGKVTSGQLEAKSSELLGKELEQLSNNALASGVQDASKWEKELEEKIGQVFRAQMEDIKAMAAVTVQQSQNQLEASKQAYFVLMAQKMANLNSEEEFMKEDLLVRKEVTDKFQQNLDSQNGASQLKKLESVLTQALNEFRPKFQVKLDGDAGTKKLNLSKAREFYCSEMEKYLKNHEFIAPENLLEKHEVVLEAALNKISHGGDHGITRQNLKEALEVTWRRFQNENQMNMDVEPAIGIDLGTTYSCVSIYQRGKVIIIPNSLGKYTTPSYVLLGDCKMVGEEAKTRAYENPEGTIFDAKRILGRRFDDEKLQEDMKLWPFCVVDGGHGIPMIEVDEKRLNPEMISAMVLAQLKKDAEAYLKRKVTKAVITVPAYFTDGQKQATIDAGKMAHLEVLSILAEPVAAAMAYNLQYSYDENGKDEVKERYILIFDLGGGTFDVAVLKTNKGEIEVLTVDGDTHLGGEDFDRNLMNHCAEEFKKIHNVDLFAGKESAMKRIREGVRRRLKRLQGECEQQKILLTTGRLAHVSVTRIYGDLDLKVTVTRRTFEKINEHLFKTTIQVVDKALKSAKVDQDQIDEIVLVGGSTRIPKIQQLLKNYFQGKMLDTKINPDEAVAHGAGLYAAILKGTITKDSTAFTKIQDVTPMPIGVEVYGGGFSTIIPKSTKVPVKLQELYKTAHNNQTSVQITIYEGDNPIAVNNKHLGDFYLNGVPPKAAGEENIEVEMVINKQGILHVTAKCSSTGRGNKIKVTENKQRMGEQAIKHYLAAVEG